MSKHTENRTTMIAVNQTSGVHDYVQQCNLSPVESGLHVSSLTGTTYRVVSGPHTREEASRIVQDKNLR